MSIGAIAASLAALLFGGCAPDAQAPAAPPVAAACPFDLARPTRTFELPHELHELSAIAVLDQRTVACVQDEKGALFLFDLVLGKVVRELRFGDKGDYEGLARVGDDYYVLRSDGLLLHLAPDGKHLRQLAVIPLGLPLPESEGICPDAGGKRLWIAPKEFGKQPKEHRDDRPLFQFDLTAQQSLPEPALVLSIAAVERMALQLGVDLPTRTTQKGKERVELELHFSDITVRPQTGELYLLSSVDHLLVVVSPTGAVRHVARLDDKLLPQPESVAFLPDGDLLLGSEGGEGKARLCRYRLQPAK